MPVAPSLYSFPREELFCAVQRGLELTAKSGLDQQGFGRRLALHPGELAASEPVGYTSGIVGGRQLAPSLDVRGRSDA